MHFKEDLRSLNIMWEADFCKFSLIRAEQNFLAIGRAHAKDGEAFNMQECSWNAEKVKKKECAVFFVNFYLLFYFAQPISWSISTNRWFFYPQIQTVENHLRMLKLHFVDIKRKLLIDIPCHDVGVPGAAVSYGCLYVFGKLVFG